MKVKMLTSMAKMNVSWEFGRVVEIEDYIGEAWEKAGIARAVEDEEGTAEDDFPVLKGAGIESNHKK